MMLVAVNANDRRLLDLTSLSAADVDRLNGKRVARRHGFDVVCQGCHRPAHLVRNHHGTVFFRHDPGHASDCIITEVVRRGGGESGEHIAAKAQLVTAIRNLSGWHAEPEQRHERDGEVVIADVAAVYGDTPRHTGQGRFAWEVQLSPQTTGEFIERTAEFRRVADLRARWLTPHAAHVGAELAMICNAEATHIVERLLLSYEPEIASPPLLVGQVVKSVHRARPGHRWFQRGDAGPWYVAHIDAFGRPLPRRQREDNRSGSTGEHAPCLRTPVEVPWTQIELDFTHPDDEHHCASCDKPVAAPWGSKFDPPLCRKCFESPARRLMLGAMSPT